MSSFVSALAGAPAQCYKSAQPSCSGHVSQMHWLQCIAYHSGSSRPCKDFISSLIVLNKSNMWRKGFVVVVAVVIITGYSHHWGEVKAGTHCHITSTIKSREKQMCPAACLHSSSFLFSSIVQNTCLGNGAAHNKLGLSTSMNSQDNPTKL